MRIVLWLGVAILVLISILGFGGVIGLAIIWSALLLFVSVILAGVGLLWMVWSP
jgi:hypothetical protein